VIPSSAVVGSSMQAFEVSSSLQQALQEFVSANGYSRSPSPLFWVLAISSIATSIG
jgi:hypothetical protein